MIKLSKYMGNRFVTAFIGLFAMLSVASAPLEQNPQSCGMMISKLKAKKSVKDEDLPH